MSYSKLNGLSIIKTGIDSVVIKFDGTNQATVRGVSIGNSTVSYTCNANQSAMWTSVPVSEGLLLYTYNNETTLTSQTLVFITRDGDSIVAHYLAETAGGYIVSENLQILTNGYRIIAPVYGLSVNLDSEHTLTVNYEGTYAPYFH